MPTYAGAESVDLKQGSGVSVFKKTKERKTKTPCSPSKLKLNIPESSRYILLPCHINKK